MNDENLNKDLFNKNNPFKIPEGYFEDFTFKLMQNIENESQNTNKITFWHSWKYKIAVAASIVILFSFSFGLYFYSNNNKIANSKTANLIDSNTAAELYFVDESHIIEGLTTNTKEQNSDGDDLINYLEGTKLNENTIAELY